LGDYTGLAGPKLLKAEMLKMLGTETTPTEKKTKSKTKSKSKEREIVIHLLVKENPKRSGTKSFDRFALYKDGMTIQEYCDAGGDRGDIRWDAAHEFISIEG